MPNPSELLSGTLEEHFDSPAIEASFLPRTVNAENRTINAVWYGGATVDRVNQETGKPYKLRLDMGGAKLQRLNSGAPVFDNHITPSGLGAIITGKTGHRAQIGVVRKAWTDGKQGFATLQFKKPVPGSLDTASLDQIWSDVSTGMMQKLSFGTWITKLSPDETAGPQGFAADDEQQTGPQSLLATEWEPFEVSPVCVAADFTTQFLSADFAPNNEALPAPQQPAATRASAQKEQPVMPNEPIPQAAGATEPAPAVVNAAAQSVTQATAPLQLHLNASPSDLLNNASHSDLIGALNAIRSTTPAPIPQTPPIPVQQSTMSTTNTPVPPGPDPAALKAAIAEATRLERERGDEIRAAAKPFAAQFDDAFITNLVAEGLSVEVSRNRILDKLAEAGSATPTRGAVAITRDQTATRRTNMEASLLYRSEPNKWSEFAEAGREYAGSSLIDLARECLDAAGVKTKGLNKHDIARLAVQGRFAADAEEHFAISAGSTSDFPGILANVVNKSLRKAYQLAPSTFKPLGRQVTAADFKPKYSLQLSDVVALPLVNESGEYTRTLPTESKETYSIATYGQIIAITRKTIINDDLNAFTRIPALLGNAAARMEADKVWAIITTNGNMADGNALFSTAHSNLLTTSGSALGVTGLGAAKAAFRGLKAPQGTILNLVPSYLVVPAALEQTAEQLVSPLNIASTDFSKVVPQWVRSLNVIVEPRLDADSLTAWYLVADPSTIDGIEYCYLQGQEGIYSETRQGFEIDGVEVKARLDFGAAAVEYRGLQKNAGV